MEQIIADARSNLTLRVQEFLRELEEGSTTLELDFEKIKIAALKMMEDGYPIGNLNSMFKLKVFDEGEERYFLRAEGLEDPEAVRSLPAKEVVSILLTDLIHQIENEANYLSADAFERNVHQRYLALLALFYFASNPLFYGV